jgi:hypothetical protein
MVTTIKFFPLLGEKNLLSIYTHFQILLIFYQLSPLVRREVVA